MSCYHYQHALLELAAGGAEPDPELQGHLQICPSCLSAFENERSLFASIDSNLRSAVNAEVPSSFVPTARAQLQRDAPPARASRRRTGRLIWLSAFATAIILITFTPLERRVPLDKQIAIQQTESSVAAQNPAILKPSQAVRPRIAPQIANRVAVDLHKSSASTKNREPEVIVPPDQEILLAHYADRWSHHRHSSSILLVRISPSQPEALEIPLIQIAELDVKRLADQEYDLRQK